MAFHIDPTPPQSENRLLAPLPSRPENIARLKIFLAGCEAYFDDHFGCRRVLVMWHNKLKWSLFRESNARSVLVGTDGWMFLSSGQMIEHFHGALQFTEKQLNDWQKLLEHRRDWLARHGIQYIFVLAPDKHSIYPEYLPAWLKDLGGRTKADQFVAYMKAHSTVEVLDLRPLLLAAKKSAPVYLKTDTHWNQFGAFITCEDVIQTLAQRELPGLVPVALESFERTNRITAGGDLANLLGIRAGMAESNAVFFTPKPELPALETSDPAGEHYRDMAFASNPHGSGLAVVYQDSFGRCWVPFLGYHFGRVEFYFQYELDGARLEPNKPVVVINEMLERMFNTTDPEELMTHDNLR